MIKYINYLILIIISFNYGCSSQNNCSNTDQELDFFLNVKLTKKGINFLNNKDINSENLKIISNDNNLLSTIDYKIILSGENQVLKFSMANTKNISFKFNQDIIASLQVENIKSTSIGDCILKIDSFDVFIKSNLICSKCNTKDIIKIEVL